ncbi:hypothetical protein NBRGN_026_00760 [Nocardia brasiliensis NBRC 14402]|nr:hypothetical protein NBRGN_026_00760 [Nocardia brasiliensis NBRC 14402]
MQQKLRLSRETPAECRKYGPIPIVREPTREDCSEERAQRERRTERDQTGQHACPYGSQCATDQRQRGQCCEATYHFFSSIRARFDDVLQVRIERIQIGNIVATI